MKKKKKFCRLLTSKIDFESTILALFVKLSFIDRFLKKFFPLSMLILGQKNLAFQNPPSLKFHNRTDNNVQLPNTSRFQKMLSHETQAFKTAQNGALLNGANLSLIFAIFLSYSSLRQNDRNQFQNYRSILSRVSIFEFR